LGGVGKDVNNYKGTAVVDEEERENIKVDYSTVSDSILTESGE
jgi:hypothetical protein